MTAMRPLLLVLLMLASLHAMAQAVEVSGDEMTVLTVFDAPTGPAFKRVFIRRKADEKR